MYIVNLNLKQPELLLLLTITATILTINYITYVATSITILSSTVLLLSLLIKYIAYTITKQLLLMD